ncbi:MAG TPA: hypothetical protein VN451_06845 [Chitinophagaceae bacterium]|nr:hypothetical protein [Chitinophagaceae bacterium]
MKKIIFGLLVMAQYHSLTAQSVGIGTTTPSASALLDVTSTSKGLLIPRMTGAQRTAIATPAIGLMVIQTNTEIVPPSSPGLYLCEQVGAFPVWRRIARTDEITSGTSTWTLSGSNQYSNVAGNVGIGIGAPTSKLHLIGNLLQDNGTITMNNAVAAIQLQNTGVNKGFLQLSGNNLTLGTNNGNDLGKFVIGMDGSDKVFVDSTGNLQIVGEQLASLTEHGHLMLGSTNTLNMVMDMNVIQARNNGAGANLYLQPFTGNLGIGSVVPADKVEINGSLRLHGGSQELKFETDQAVNTTVTPKPGISFIRTNNTLLGRMEYVDTFSFANFMRFRMGDNIVNGLTINTSNHTGMGTADPLGRLHVRGETGIDEIAINSGNISESATIQFYGSFVEGTASTKRGFVQLDGSDLKIGTNSGNTVGRFVIRTDGADRVFVDEAGIVSIGTQTAAAGYMLRLGGKMICEEVKVKLQGNWPDYVFNKNYNLLSFSELEKYIQVNHHLPSIPPAAEIQQNGFELGDMQKRLLEKVEELTLYILQLHKEIELLKKANPSVK